MCDVPGRWSDGAGLPTYVEGDMIWIEGCYRGVNTERWASHYGPHMEREGDRAKRVSLATCKRKQSHQALSSAAGSVAAVYLPFPLHTLAHNHHAHRKGTKSHQLPKDSLQMKH